MSCVKYTKEELIADLEHAGVNPAGTLLVHSSMKSIGAVEGGAETVLDALMEYMQKGLLVIPCHTWSDVNTEHPVFDVLKSKSCIGILPELFRQRAGVSRSLHPTHSLCAAGRGGVDFLRGQERFDTPCAPDSCYGELLRKNAQILLIGVNFGRNTAIHCIEEMKEVPNRLTESCEPLIVIDQNGNAIECPQHRHDGAESDKYVKLEPVMAFRKQLKIVPFGLASCLLMNGRDLLDTTLEMLERDINILGDFEKIPHEYYITVS